MKKIIIILVLFSASMFAQEFKKNGTSGFTFLEVPATARTAALGETSIALSDMNSDAVFSNPAALGFTQLQQSVGFSYSTWLADIKNYATSYAFNSPVGVFALGAVVFDYGTMPRTMKIPGQRMYEVRGSFTAAAMAIGLSYSKMLTDRFAFGVTAKYANEKIDSYSAYNFLFDGGVLYYTGLSSLRIAASIQNFGIDAKFIENSVKMPSWLRLGMAAEVLGDYNSEYRVTTSVEMVHARDADERINSSAELAWRNTIILRGGYKFFYDEESYSFGVGLNPHLTTPVALDFAYSDYGRLGNILRFTLQLGLL